MSKTGFKKGRLGIGTDDPIYPLDVVGDIRLTGGFRDASGNDFNFIALAGPDVVRSSDLADSITGIICKDNCVGIFNNNPSQSLDVSGNIRLTGDLLDINGAARVFSNWTVDGTNIFRNSKVTIDDNSVNTNYSLYVNGDVKFSETNVSKLKNHLSSGTGIWYDYANIQRFIINNEEKMRIHSDGNVGIGETSPDAKLHVNATSTLGICSMGDYTDYNFFLNGPRPGKSKGDGAVLYITSENSASHEEDSTFTIRNDSGPIRLGKDNSKTTIEGNDIILNSNVGIGTPAPERTLHLYGNRTDIVFERSGDEKHYIRKDGDFLRFRGHDDSTVLFEIKNNTNGNNECSFPNGKVGIGTNSPDNLLHIQKSDTGYGSNPDALLVLERNDTNNSWINFVTKDGKEAGLLFGSSTNTAHGAITYRNTDGMTFRTGKTSGNNTRMAIDGSGNVGIGTTSPDSLFHIFTNENRGSTNTTNKTMLTIESATTQDCNTNNFNPISIDFVMGDNQAPKGVARIGSLMCPTGSTHSTVEGEAGTALTFSTQGIASGALPEERMRITYNGNVGIGTTSPICKLDVNSPEAWTQTSSSSTRSELAPSDYIASFRPSGDNQDAFISIRASGESKDAGIYFGTPAYTSTPNKAAIIAEGVGGYSKCKLHFCLATNSNNSYGQASLDATEGKSMMAIQHNGNVGIGTTEPGHKLEIENTSGHSFVCSKNGSGKFFVRNDGIMWSYGSSTNILNDGSRFDYLWWSGGEYGSASDRHNITHGSMSFWIDSAVTYVNHGDNMYMSAYFSAAVYSKFGFMYGSDKRIKKNIVDVPDSSALEMVRNIPCRYYDYIDPIKGTEKTIGFIAQEVREHFPQAVKIGVNEIPSVMKELTSENSSWEDLSSENDEKFRLTYHDLSNNLLDQEYVFYSYDISNGKITNEERIQIITEPNKFNSFLFTKKFDNLFCYGKMVDDFHSIEKGKIFTLHHSAIQELDKQRQADKAKIAELEAKNTELESKNTELETKVTTLESTLETILARLTALENTPTE